MPLGPASPSTRENTVPPASKLKMPEGWRMLLRTSRSTESSTHGTGHAGMEPGVLLENGREQGRPGTRKPGDEVDICFHERQEPWLNSGARWRRLIRIAATNLEPKPALVQVDDVAEHGLKLLRV